jgi:hypothetical protein
MRILTLIDVERAIQSSWGADTSFAKADYLARVPGRASRGQCGATALVVQDFFGGELLIADLFINGQLDGVHYWNRLPSGIELDLTRDQLEPDEAVVNIRVVAAERENLTGEGARTYWTLRRRVLAALDLPADEAADEVADEATG